MFDLWNAVSIVFLAYNAVAGAALWYKPQLLVKRADARVLNVLRAYALKHIILAVMGLLFLASRGYVPDEYTLAVGLFHILVLASNFWRERKLSQIVVLSHGTLSALFLVALGQRKGWI